MNAKALIREPEFRPSMGGPYGVGSSESVAKQMLYSFGSLELYGESPHRQPDITLLRINGRPVHVWDTPSMEF
jgi:hypothetical protein